MKHFNISVQQGIVGAFRLLNKQLKTKIKEKKIWVGKPVIQILKEVCRNSQTA